jgi:uncharacterized ferredoxin-like protein
MKRSREALPLCFFARIIEMNLLINLNIWRVVMYIDSKTAEENAVLNAAYAVCAAARTAPKACGVDFMKSAVLTGEDKDRLTEAMRRLSGKNGDTILVRDAGNVDKATAVVLVGITDERRGLNKICQLCHFEDCKACAEAGACCVFSGIDLGIALGSAVSLVTDLRIDTRIMFTIGKAAASLKLLGDDITLIMGIPMSVSGKSPFFDRK